jgi:hypothetical protein
MKMEYFSKEITPRQRMKNIIRNVLVETIFEPLSMDEHVGLQSGS